MKEAEIQREIVAFLKMVGCAVYQTSQGYRRDPGGTRMTPGLPDLLVMHGPGQWTFAEVKTAKGRLSPAQYGFEVNASAAGIPWALWRDVDDAWQWAKDVGLVEEAA